MADNGIKAKLSSLTDAELYEIINAVCIAAGMDQKKASAMTADIPKLRRMLLALSDKQIVALIGSLGTADRQDIMQRLGSQNG